MSIDQRHNYLLIVDTETANTLAVSAPDGKERLDMSNVLAYDIGWCVMDTAGNVYEERSYVNSDIFVHERDLMKTAYYASKIPQYIQDLQNGTRQMANSYEIRQAMLADMETYHVTAVVAHNARFDLNALNTLQRWATKSKFRYWFPFGTEIWDTMRCARSVIHKMPTYRDFCEKNGYLTPNGALSTTAENLYRFISGNNDFQEEHKGLDDVRIEREIFLYCKRQHKAMEKELFQKEEEAESLPLPTPMQKRIMQLAHYQELGAY